MKKVGKKLGELYNFGNYIWKSLKARTGMGKINLKLLENI